MSIKKQYKKKLFKKGSSPCKVTFSLPEEMINPAKTVYLVGEFNNWDVEATPMKKKKDGTYSVTIELEAQKEYQFRYLIDSDRWENDGEADKYAATPYSSENSVVVV